MTELAYTLLDWMLNVHGPPSVIGISYCFLYRNFVHDVLLDDIKMDYLR